MPAGLRIYNTGGSLQIDENFFNLIFINKGTANATVNLREGRKATISMPSGTSANHILALNCSTNGLVVLRRSLSSGIYSYEIWGKASANFTFTWYLFDVAPSTSSINSGLIIRNSSGAITYSTEFKPMRVVSVFTGTYTWTGNNPPSDSPSPNFNMTLTSGPTYAFVPGYTGRWRYRLQAGGGDAYKSTFYYYGTVINTSTGLYHELENYYRGTDSFSSSNLNQRKNDYSIMAIDVTNY